MITPFLSPGGPFITLFTVHGTQFAAKLAANSEDQTETTPKQLNNPNNSGTVTFFNTF